MTSLVKPPQPAHWEWRKRPNSSLLETANYSHLMKHTLLNVTQTHTSTLRRHNRIQRSPVPSCHKGSSIVSLNLLCEIQSILMALEWLCRRKIREKSKTFLQRTRCPRQDCCGSLLTMQNLSHHFGWIPKGSFVGSMGQILPGAWPYRDEAECRVTSSPSIFLM